MWARATKSRRKNRKIKFSRELRPDPEAYQIFTRNYEKDGDSRENMKSIFFAKKYGLSPRMNLTFKVKTLFRTISPSTPLARTVCAAFCQGSWMDIIRILLRWDLVIIRDDLPFRPLLFGWIIENRWFTFPQFHGVSWNGTSTCPRVPALCPFDISPQSFFFLLLWGLTVFPKQLGV